MLANYVVDVRDQDYMYGKTEPTPKERDYDGITSLSTLYSMTTPLVQMTGVQWQEAREEVAMARSV